MESARVSKISALPGWLWAALIFAIVAAVFRSALDGAFLRWDDDINMVANPHLRALTWENVRWMFSDADYMRRYVPLAWLSWSIEHRLVGLTAGSAHFGNILLHAMNAVLVFWLLRMLFQVRPADGAVGEATIVWGAALGALFWAAHPLRVEVVAWASGRMYCQAGFFLLMAGLAYLKAARGDVGSGERRGWLVLSVGAFGASLLTYPIGLPFVLVLVVLDWCLLRRLQAGAGWFAAPNRAVWREKIPFVVMAGLVGVVTLGARFRAQGLWEPPPGLGEFGIGARAVQACYVWLYYVWKPFFPFELAPVYTALVSFQPGSWPFIGSAVGVVAVTAGLFWQRRRLPGGFALWLVHLLLLAPMLGLTERPHYTNDRYSYLQGMLWSVAITAAVVRLRPNVGRVAGIAAAMAIAVCAALSMKQIQIWRDSETLFRHLYVKLDGSMYRGDIALRLGELLRGQLRFREAEIYYRESLRIASTTTRAGVAHFGLGTIARAEGRRQDAIEHFQAASVRQPEAPEAHLALGELLLEEGRPGDAVAALRRAVGLQPADDGLRHRLAQAYLEQGRTLREDGRIQESAAAWRAALEVKPDYAEARTELDRLSAAASEAR